MSRIYVKLFDTPFVLKNDDKVNFPFMKAEALFYYLVIKKQATRDELVDIFWGESGEKAAKKNLRNAMYKIRKTFDMDIIISPQKSKVILNSDIEIDSDLDSFLKNDQNSVKSYDGEFLKGFMVKKALKFNEWVLNTREYYRSIYITKLHEIIRNLISKNDYSKAEHYGQLLIKEDEFNEGSYRILMNIYKQQENYDKAIKLYNRLAKILKEELGIVPDIKTKKLYDDIVYLLSSREINSPGISKELFYGREREIEEITKNFYSFINNKDFKSVLITGEAGIGKTKLRKKFIEVIKENEVIVLKSNCYQVEENYFLKPWNNIFSKLSSIIKNENIYIPVAWRKMISYLFPEFDAECLLETKNPIEQLDTLKFHVIEEAIIEVFKEISKRKKIILAFEDLQWMDSMSLSLLSGIVLRNQNVMMIATCRSGYNERINRFITGLRAENLLNIIEIPRFNRKEMEEFIYNFFPNKKIDNVIKERIFNETEGNTFFLVEYLNIIKEKGNLDTSIPSKIQNILKSRFIDISDQGKKVLSIASIFFDKVTLNFIKTLLGKDEFEIIDIIEELQSKYIIQETGDDDVSFQFTHQKLREFVYLNLSTVKRKILHNKAAMALEDSLKKDKTDISSYTKLIYHFSNAGNNLSTLKYTIKYLDTYLDFNHELFPVINDIEISNQNYLYMNKKQIEKYFEEIDELFRTVKGTNSLDDEIIKLEISFLHIKGRYLIREGEYEKGLKYIDEMIKKSVEIESYPHTLKGYRQKVYYSIQVHNIEMMSANVDLGLEVACSQNLKEDIAIFLRFKGLNRLLQGEYKEGEELLRKSIEVFSRINFLHGKYSLNIAACYNYIGEIRRYRMRFSEALEFYDKAMKICEEKRILRGLTIFNTNAGQAAFEMGDYFKAKEYIEKALNIYRQLDSLWGRSIAEGYMALIECKEGNYSLALRHLKKAEFYSEKLKSPYEIGITYRVKAEIKSNMESNEKLRKVFSGYLDLDLKEYCNKGIRLLQKVRESYESEILKALKR